MSILSTSSSGVGKEKSTQFPEHLTTDLSAPLLQSLPACGRLWALARICDREGRGYAKISISQAVQYLGISKQSVRRYVRQALEIGLIRGYECESGFISFYYMSQVKAAHMRGLEALGAIGRFSVADLHELKISATDVQVQALQRSSLYAKAETEGIKLSQMPTIDDLLTESSTICQGAPLLKIGERYALYADDAPLYGGSQEGIGELLGVSDRTVRRRMSDSYREKKGVLPIFKKQAAIRLPLDPRNWAKEARQCFDFGQREEGMERLRYLNAVDPSTGKLSVFRRQCNLYALNVELVSKRHLRKDYRHFSMSTGRAGASDLSLEVDSKMQEKQIRAYNKGSN